MRWWFVCKHLLKWTWNEVVFLFVCFFTCVSSGMSLSNGWSFFARSIRTKHCLHLGSCNYIVFPVLVMSSGLQPKSLVISRVAACHLYYIYLTKMAVRELTSATGDNHHRLTPHQWQGAQQQRPEMETHRWLAMEIFQADSRWQHTCLFFFFKFAFFKGANSLYAQRQWKSRNNISCMAVKCAWREILGLPAVTVTWQASNIRLVRPTKFTSCLWENWK